MEVLVSSINKTKGSHFARPKWTKFDMKYDTLHFSLTSGQHHFSLNREVVRWQLRVLPTFRCCIIFIFCYFSDQQMAELYVYWETTRSSVCAEALRTCVEDQKTSRTLFPTTVEWLWSCQLCRGDCRPYFIHWFCCLSLFQFSSAKKTEVMVVNGCWKFSFFPVFSG